jgi:2-methylcitrate dehydratase PrpD
MRSQDADKTYSEKLADFVDGLNFDDIPEDVLAQTKLHVLDTLGVAVASHGMEFSKILQDFVKGLGGPAESTVVGSGVRIPAHYASLVNAAMVHGRDFDDMHREGSIHLSALVVPSALAVAEASGTSGKAALVAIVAGYEVGARIGNAACRKLLDRGWHPTGIFGAFTSAVVAGKILGSTAGQIATAIGIAGSQCSGSAQWLEEASWTKRIHPGWASHSGILAAKLGQTGYNAPRKIFEGGKGIYRSYLTEGEFDLSKITKELGKKWETREICYKIYPSGY